MVGIVKRGKRKGKQETLRGLTTGVIKMSGLRQLLWCMVAGDNFPSWFPHCGALGLEVVCVQVRAKEFINIIEQHVSDTCVIQVGPISSSMPSASAVFLKGGDKVSFELLEIIKLY